MHKGCAVKSGSKYILRTDVSFFYVLISPSTNFFNKIMFKRIDKRNIEDYKSLPAYQEAEKHYQDSIRYQQEGDPVKSTESYLIAMEMQAKLSSISSRVDHMDSLNHLPQLPIEIWSLIGSYLSIQDLCNWSITCRYFKYLSEDGFIWREKYFSHFTKIFPNVADDKVLSNWKLLYRDQLVIQKYFPIVFLYFLPSNTFYGSSYEPLAAKPINSRDHEWDDKYSDRRGAMKDTFYTSMPSIAAKVLGHYWGAGSGCSDYLVGEECHKRQWYGAEDFLPFIEKKDNGKKLQFRDSIENVIYWIFSCAFSVFLSQRSHPTLLIVPFNEKDEIEKLTNILFSKLTIFNLSIKSDAEIVLFATNLNNAIILSFITENVLCIVPVNNRKVIPGKSCSFFYDDKNFDFAEFSKALHDIVSTEEELLSQQGIIHLRLIGKFIPEGFTTFCESNLNTSKFNFSGTPLSVMDGTHSFIHDPSVRNHFFNETLLKMNPEYISIY